LKRSTRGEIARVITVLGAGVVIASLWTNWFTGETVFESFLHIDTVVLVVAIVAAVLAVADRFVWSGLLPIAGSLGLFIGGLALAYPIEFEFENTDVGLILGLAGAAAMWLAGTVASAGTDRDY
jgi:hypothetical protein